MAMWYSRRELATTLGSNPAGFEEFLEGVDWLPPEREVRTGRYSETTMARILNLWMRAGGDCL